MDTTERIPFGRLLQSYRLGAGISQEQLAERAGLSVRSISDLERGLRRIPRLETVRLLADGLDLEADDRTELLRSARPSMPIDLSAASGPRDLAPRLPVPPTPLVGRRDEIASIAARIAAKDGPRLITLTGPGGVGKTRYVLEIVPTVAASFPDGVAYVELAPVVGPDLVVPAIADVLAVHESAGMSIQEAVELLLRNRRFLLVLDNFEHVLPAAPVVADLLATCPGLTVLITSREPLHVRGERQVSILPLAVPPPSSATTLADLTRTDAVRLFIARAREIKSSLDLGEGNVTAVAGICRQLDGLPLALELAAVWTKVLPPPELLRRLERRLPLLTGGAPDMPSRHQTLRATIGWSHDLLSPELRVLFRRLAVFTGGWTLESAEAVAASEGDLDVLDGLAALVDKSLVQTPVVNGGEPRFRMLETGREVALEQLAHSGEADVIGRRHAEYSLSLAQDAAANLADAVRTGGLARLEAEQANLRAALAWLRDRGLTAEGLRLATAMGGFWRLRSAHAEGRSWLETFLTAEDTPGLPASDRVAALRWAGELAGLAGDPVSAEARLTESLSLARESGDASGIAAALGAMASALVHRGDAAASLPLFEEAVALARGGDDWRQTSFLLAYLAAVTGRQGDAGRAGELLAESQSLHHALGDTRSFEGVFLIFVDGWIALMAGDHARAGGRLEAARALSRDIDARAIESATLACLGEVALAEDRIEDAGACFREGVLLGWKGSYPPGMGMNLQGIVRMAVRQGDAAWAARLVGAMDLYGAAIHMLPGNTVTAYERAAGTLHRALDNDTYVAERARGRALRPEEVVAEALASGEEAGSFQEGG